MRKRRRFKIPFKIIGVITASVLCMLVVMFMFLRFLVTSEHFQIKDTQCANIIDKRLQQDKHHYLMGNIFKLDLQAVARKLSRLYPDYNRIILRRILPNRIIIDLEPRKVLARVKLSKYFYVDKQGIIFSPITDGYESMQLPLITGLEKRLPDPRSGMKYNENSLLKILHFIDNLNRDRQLAGQIEIEKINLANVNDVFLYTTSDCKINLGGISYLNKKLLILQSLVGKIDFDLSKIKYIDLRFREPVVKYR